MGDVLSGTIGALLAQDLPPYCAAATGVYWHGLAADLCAEAIRLTKLLCVLMPDEPEAFGLLALLLLQHSRCEARVGTNGERVLLADQDRALWDPRAIDEGIRVLRRAEALLGRSLDDAGVRAELYLALTRQPG